MTGSVPTEAALPAGGVTINKVVVKGEPSVDGQVVGKVEDGKPITAEAEEEKVGEGKGLDPKSVEAQAAQLIPQAEVEIQQLKITGLGRNILEVLAGQKALSTLDSLRDRIQKALNEKKITEKTADRQMRRLWQIEAKAKKIVEGSQQELETMQKSENPRTKALGLFIEEAYVSDNVASYDQEISRIEKTDYKKLECKNEEEKQDLIKRHEEGKDGLRKKAADLKKQREGVTEPGAKPGEPAVEVGKQIPAVVAEEVKGILQAMGIKEIDAAAMEKNPIAELNKHLTEMAGDKNKVKAMVSNLIEAGTVDKKTGTKIEDALTLAQSESEVVWKGRGKTALTIGGGVGVLLILLAWNAREKKEQGIG